MSIDFQIEKYYYECERSRERSQNLIKRIGCFYHARKK